MIEAEQTHEEYSEHMNGLVLKISEAVDGEDMFDVASACALVMAYAIANIIEPTSRSDALDVLIKFMQAQSESISEEMAQEGQGQ
jgi:hypothetical protein